MSHPILSADDAARLNRLVAERLDPRFFLFCNYEPTLSYAISEDAKFLTAIQDLYKFAVDSSCILPQYQFISPACDDRLKTALDHIRMLRAVTDHNHSVQNGKLEQEMLENYAVWMKSVLRKSHPESAADFAALNRELAKTAGELIVLIEEFIDFVDTAPNKAEILTRWLNRTLYWYSHHTKTAFYEGQLMDTYIVNAKRCGKLSDPQPLWKLKLKISKWIRTATYERVCNALQEIDGEIDKANRVLAGTAPMCALLSKLPEAQREEFFSNLREEIRQSELQKESLLQEKAELDNLAALKESDCIKEYTRRFYDRLQDQLRETMDRLDESGETYTLLPQDLLKKDVASYFKGIPSPENDF